MSRSWIAVALVADTTGKLDSELGSNFIRVDGRRSTGNAVSEAREHFEGRRKRVKNYIRGFVLYRNWRDYMGERVAYREEWPEEQDHAEAN